MKIRTGKVKFFLLDLPKMSSSLMHSPFPNNVDRLPDIKHLQSKVENDGFGQSQVKTLQQVGWLNNRKSILRHFI